MRLLALALHRLAWFVPTLLGLLVLTFVISRVIPADPVALVAGETATPAQVEALRRQLGYDRPLPVQFVGYVGDMDFSGTYTSADVTLLQRLIVRTDTFAAGADDVDAVILGDVDSNGVLNATDAALLTLRTRAASTPLIPIVPVIAAAPTISPLSLSVLGDAGEESAPAGTSAPVPAARIAAAGKSAVKVGKDRTLCSSRSGGTAT